jgi:AcrR family transcriptional regulator
VARAKIMHAAAEVIAERGYARTTDSIVSRRAGVTRETYHKHYRDVDDCAKDILDQALITAEAISAAALTREVSWQDGMRGAFVDILSFLDANPPLAKTLMVELLTASPTVQAHREQVTAAFSEHVGHLLRDKVPQTKPEAIGTAMFESVMGLVRRRINRSRDDPLITLLGEFMDVFMSLFGAGDRELAAEQASSRARVEAMLALATPNGDVHVQGVPDWTGAAAIPRGLADPRSGRRRECLLYVADHRGCSNRELAATMTITAPRVSAVLGYLKDEELIVNFSPGPGRLSAWHITDLGRQALHALASLRSAARH